MNQTDTSFIKRGDERRSWHGETGEAEEEKKGRLQFFLFCSHLLCVVLFLASVSLSAAASVFPLFTEKKRQILEGSVNHYPLLTP